jgi:hypothetical protein
MTVQVSFLTPAGAGSINAPIIGDIRVREPVSVGSSTTATAQAGEVAMVYNGETGPIWIAHGTSPDAATTASTATSSAGVTLGPAERAAIALKAGSKINVKAVS